MDFSTEVSSPTPSHPASHSPSLFSDSNVDCLDCVNQDSIQCLTCTETCMDVMLLPATLPSLHLPPSPTFSASPPALPLLEVCSPSGIAMPCHDVEPQVQQPPSAPERVYPVAAPPASDCLGPSRPVSALAPPTFGSTRPLGLSTQPGSLIPAPPPW